MRISDFVKEVSPYNYFKIVTGQYIFTGFEYHTFVERIHILIKKLVNDEVEVDSYEEIDKYVAKIKPHETLHREIELLSDDLKIRSDTCITGKELSLIMKWKLSRGTYRPALQSMIDKLKNADVIDYSRSAFTHIKNGYVKLAIQKLSELKGVGPATSTMILSLYDPTIAYMSDEAIAHVSAEMKYTVDIALAVIDLFRGDEQMIPADREKICWSA